MARGDEGPLEPKIPVGVPGLRAGGAVWEMRVSPSLLCLGRNSQKWRGKSSTKSLGRRVSSYLSLLVKERWTQEVCSCHASVYISSEFWTTMGLMERPRGEEGSSATGGGGGGGRGERGAKSQ